MQLISTFGSVEISTFFSVIEMYIKISEMSNFWLSVLSGSISNVHTCVKVYTSCQFVTFFTKCTMLLHIRSTNIVKPFVSGQREIQWTQVGQTRRKRRIRKCFKCFKRSLVNASIVVTSVTKQRSALRLLAFRNERGS